MLGLPLMFTVPAVLGALVLLPALYYLLRVTPPRPQRIPFPPLRLILGLLPRDERPARTPLWLLLLRLGIAALIILAMAGPIWNPATGLGEGKGPVLLVLDDGFAAAPAWDQRIAAAADALKSAERSGRTAAILALSQGTRDVGTMAPAEALQRLRALKPVPILPDRSPALPGLDSFLAAHPDADVLWIADGLENGGARAFAEHLAARAPRTGRPTILVPEAVPFALAGPENRPEALAVRVLRAGTGGPANGTVRAYDARGLTIGDAAFDLGTGSETRAAFNLPVELRNDITRLAIVGESSAGAVSLLDGRWKRRRVDIVSGATADVAQPLLSPAYFITKALAPYADVREVRAGTADPIVKALEDNPAVLILADVGAVAGAAHDQLVKFIDNGGLLLRFAGTRLASAADDLEPVTLRRGGRTFGGALSWDKPQALAPFDRASPFYGLVPPPDVAVNRQVLAEPDAGLPAKTWAQLVDGTPLVTAQKRGKGTIVLFHLTADTTWSNLPLSGLFVDMLRRVVDLASVGAPGPTEAGAAAPALAPSRSLDGFGTLGAPPADAKPIPASFTGPASADHPPGFYGPVDAAVAVNALAPDAVLTPAGFQGLDLRLEPLQPAQPIDLRAALVVLAVVGFLADGIATLWLGGGLTTLRRRAATALVLLAALAAAAALPGAAPARADETLSKRDMDAALTTRLAYVVTGDATVDDASRSGLHTLSRALASRTSLDPGEPVAVDPGRDELAFYPLIYWPVVASAPQPSAEAIARVAAFMKNGGTVVFDTRDALTARPGGPPSPEGLWLRRVLAGVDVPELEPVPRDHVITKTFYLIDNFVGRYAAGQTWIEALPPAPPGEVNRPARSGDSVSPILITGNDLASGWASDAEGEPLYPLVPGGLRQREIAIRGGINLVMYTLTGNYKADQVHVRDLLERLSH